MWIDTRTDDIKVYEKQPSDPWVKKMTWVPEENAWVLFAPVTPVQIANTEFVHQAEIMRQFDKGEMNYAEMRMHCG